MTNSKKSSESAEAAQSSEPQEQEQKQSSTKAKPKAKPKTKPNTEARAQAGPAPRSDKTEGVLYLGIDLGTSRTSVAASNGIRETVASYVGYPKDVVSRKLLNRDVLFGDDAVKNRLALNFFRPLEHGVIKSSNNGEYDDNLRAAKDLIGEIIRRAQPRTDELVYAVIGAPAQASINNKDAILQAAKETVDSVMLCSEPFSVAYGLDMLDDVLVIDIGAGTTDLCRMHGTMPEEADQVTITFAGDFVDNRISELLAERHPEAQFTIQMVKQMKERHASVAEQAIPAVVSMPVNGKPTDFDVTDILREAALGIVPPIVEGLAQLIATFDPEFQVRLKDRVLLAGGGSQIRGLDTAIQAEMHSRLGGGRVVRIEEPVYGGANGALKIAHDMPAEYWEKLK